MTKRIMAAAVALTVFLLCATVQVRDDPETTPSPVPTPVTTPSWEEMGYAELSWVIEGIMERISEKEDELQELYDEFWTALQTQRELYVQEVADYEGK